MGRQQFTDTSGGGSPCVDSGLNGCCLSGHVNRNESGDCLLDSDNLYFRRLDHRIGRLYGRNEAASLNHPKSLIGEFSHARWTHGLLASRP